MSNNWIMCKPIETNKCMDIKGELDHIHDPRNYECS